MFRTAFTRCPLDGEPLKSLVDDPLKDSDFADRYVIEECIGEGAMGRVYRARHRRVSRRFAIKVLFGDHAADAKMQSRFAREAESASRLEHPNVISVIDFGETHEGLLYLVMPFIEGPSLAKLVSTEAPLATARVVHLVRQLCLGLGHAHDRGLIHRDFKGENVLVARGEDGERPKIVDLGIAVMMGSHQGGKLTTEGMVLGTPAVMSPEQAAGDEVDHRTDLFALGVVIYEMLSGVLPFEGTPLEVARHNLLSEPPPIRDRVPGLAVDPVLEEISHRLMAKRAGDRYQSAHELVHVLDQAFGSQTPTPGSLVIPRGGSGPRMVAARSAPQSAPTWTDGPTELFQRPPSAASVSTEVAAETFGGAEGRETTAVDGVEEGALRPRRAGLALGLALSLAGTAGIIAYAGGAFDPGEESLLAVAAAGVEAEHASAEPPVAPTPVDEPPFAPAEPSGESEGGEPGDEGAGDERAGDEGAGHEGAGPKAAGVAVERPAAKEPRRKPPPRKRPPSEPPPRERPPPEDPYDRVTTLHRQIGARANELARSDDPAAKRLAREYFAIPSPYTVRDPAALRRIEASLNDVARRMRAYRSR